jgi:branched-chain amino acid transport system permease protein
MSYPTSRLRGHYFAIATLAFLFVIQILFENWKFVGGAQGLTLPLMQQSSFWNFQFPESKIPYYYIMLGLLVLGVLITRVVIHSRVGYYLRALREAPEVAQSLGVNTAKYRLMAIAFSAFLSALAGTFYAQYVLYIDPPSVISLGISVEVVLISVFGGYGTIYGPLLGTIILIPLTNLLRAWLGGAGRGIAYMVFGGIIILICLLQPDGIIKSFTIHRPPVRKLNEVA